MKHSVLLDTSFFVRLLNDEDPLHQNAKGYFKYFLDKEIQMKISTISIAEYCVVGKIEDLPLKNLQIMPFNVGHAQKAGEFAELLFSEKGLTRDTLKPHPLIPNDSKLFAQADVDNSISHFVTSDSRSQATIKTLKEKAVARFEFIDIKIPYHEVFGILDLNE